MSQDKIHVMRTNTDADSIRDRRMQNQYRIEGTIGEELRDASLIDRMVSIRDKIFGEFGDVKGDRVITPRQLYVSTKLNDPTKPFVYPSPKYIGERAFPNLIKRIDSLYELVLEEIEKIIQQENIKKEKQDAKIERLAFRFASVVYTLGILVHPYIDGNGQTFRLTSLSYINELLGTTYVFDRVGKTKINVIVPKSMEGNNQGEIEIMSRRAEQIYESLETNLKVIVELRQKSTPTDIPAKNPEGVKIAINRALEYPAEKIVLGTAKSEIFQDLDNEAENIVDYILAIRQQIPEQKFSSLKDIFRYLQTPIPGFDTLIAEVDRLKREEGEKNQRVQLESLLEYTLASPEGYTLLIQYIFEEGKIDVLDERVRVIIGSFNLANSQFNQILSEANVTRWEKLKRWVQKYVSRH